MQAPESNTRTGFGARGIFKYNPKTILSGKLEVSSENEYDVGYILTDERTTEQPLISNPSYFYVPRKSDWLKQHYMLGGNIAVKVLPDFLLAAGVGGLGRPRRFAGRPSKITH